TASRRPRRTGTGARATLPDGRRTDCHHNAGPIAGVGGVPTGGACGILIRMSPDRPGHLDRLRALDPERYARRLAPVGAALCLLGAALGNAYGLLPAALGLTLLLVGCLSRDEGLLVLGPFARAELVRAARRKWPPALWRAS